MLQRIRWDILVKLWRKSLLLCCHLLAVIWINLSHHSGHLHLHLISRSWLRFDKVVSRFDIHFLLIDVVAFIAVSVDSNEPHLVLLSFVLVLELHLYKTEATTFTVGAVPHDDCVCNNAELFKIFNEV
jgi:hypothetical protein